VRTVGHRPDSPEPERDSEEAAHGQVRSGADSRRRSSSAGESLGWGKQG
jgi:hypothetical protein